MFRLSRGQVKNLALEYTLQLLIPPPEPGNQSGGGTWKDYVLSLLDIDRELLRAYEVQYRQMLPSLKRLDDFAAINLLTTTDYYGTIVRAGSRLPMPPLTAQFWCVSVCDDWDPPRIPPRLANPQMPGLWMTGPREFGSRYAAELTKKQQ